MSMRHKLVSIRGTNGSGKSTIVNELLKTPDIRPIYGALGSRNPEAYQLALPGVGAPVFVLGPYQRTQCGGCDSIIPFDTILDLLQKYAVKGHVIFEGVIVGSIYGRVGTLMEQWGKNAVAVFLDTTEEECIRRVQARRDSREDARAFNPKNLSSKYRAVLGVKKKMLNEDIVRVETVSSDGAGQRILDILGEDGGKVSRRRR